MGSIFFFSFFYIAIIESIVSARWYPTYFKFGIPIYSKAYPFYGTAPEPIGEVALNEALRQNYTPALIFKEIEPNTFAFREKMFQFRLLSYTPLMHGRLEINPNSRTINVIGLLNWWILAFIMTFLISFSKHFEAIPFMLLVLGAIYLFQKGKYDKVGKFAFEWNSRDWSKEN